MRHGINTLDEVSLFSFEILKKLKPGMICFLEGDMGAGKTTFVSLLMEHLNFFDVSSPTYSVVNEYESFPPVFHIDLYRLTSHEEVELMDLDFYFDQKTHIVFIEWPERLGQFNRLVKKIKFNRDSKGNRFADFDF